MAPTSSSSSFELESKYDVFLSFRGEDTRHTFTSHLYAALRQKQIVAFIDDVGLKRGAEISPALFKAIEGSKISVIIFSEDYASSRWCLEELEKILDCRKMKGQMVIPVFYHVNPSDVRKQTGSFEDAFRKHEERFKDVPERVRRWRAALTEVTDLSGWDSVVIRPESKLVEGIVGDIWKKLMDISSSNDNCDGDIESNTSKPLLPSNDNCADDGKSNRSKLTSILVKIKNCVAILYVILFLSIFIPVFAFGMYQTLPKLYHEYKCMNVDYIEKMKGNC